MPDSNSLVYTDYLHVLLPQGDDAEQSEVFLHYYAFPQKEKKVVQSEFTRGQFSQLVQRCVATLLHHGVRKGTRVLLHVSANRVEDLVLRAASTVLGCVPVTVNWQADSLDTVRYKLTASGAAIVLFDYQSQGIGDLRVEFPNLSFLHINELYSQSPPWEDFSQFIAQRAERDELPAQRDARCVIFTSGTTGQPKGVQLSYANYANNRATFEAFLALEEDDRATRVLVPVVVNPLHHTNSTSVTDWALRRRRVELHLLERYTGQYWAVLCGAVLGKSLTEVSVWRECETESESLRKRARESVFVVPLVSRHIDFLHTLLQDQEDTHNTLSQHTQAVPPPHTQTHTTQTVSRDALSVSLSRAVLLLGSAPVGPGTVDAVRRAARGRLPTVRFGSTETTLQVCGVPVSLSQDQAMRAFQRGWAHRLREREGEADEEKMQDTGVAGGYYIGQDHSPYTEVNIVKSVNRDDPRFLEECAEGEAGYIVTRGGHVMQQYINAPLTSSVISEEGWYLRLGDIGFYLVSEANGRKDFYWQTRDSQMLIKGGANYSFEAINAELSQFVARVFSLEPTSFRLAVCGLKVNSEHEDDCCVTIDLLDSTARVKEQDITENFLKEAKHCVSKGAKPDRLRIAAIPMLASKGIVNVPEMVKSWKAHLQQLQHS